MIGFFYPSAVQLASGALSSIYPEPDQPVLTLNAFVGDLGLDDGVPRNAYALEVDDLEQITGGETGNDSHRARSRVSRPSCRTVSAPSSSRPSLAS